VTGICSETGSRGVSGSDPKRTSNYVAGRESAECQGLHKNPQLIGSSLSRIISRSKPGIYSGRTTLLPYFGLDQMAFPGDHEIVAVTIGLQCRADLLIKGRPNFRDLTGEGRPCRNGLEERVS